MKYLRSRYYSALKLIEQYEYPGPFHLHAKSYFKANKKIGSKDRKAVLELCYTYFRTGRLFEAAEISKRLLLSCTLLELENTEEWNKLAVELGVDWSMTTDYWKERDAYWHWLSLCVQLNTDQYFFQTDFLMPEFETLNALSSMSFRPKVWAKNHKSSSKSEQLPKGCLEIENDELPNDFTQIQDLSSQRICEKVQLRQTDLVWDICCGAGGKSLNLLNAEKGSFFLSDVRSQILTNAQQRIQSFGYQANFAEINLEKEVKSLKFKDLDIENPYFDVIIADVPCSGSGTWFRTPEHFSHFNYLELPNYANRQKSIVTNAFRFLKSGGLFYYITCSVFKEENTEVKLFILNTLDCELEQEIIYNGQNDFADSMYMCCFRKS